MTDSTFLGSKGNGFGCTNGREGKILFAHELKVESDDDSEVYDDLQTVFFG
jgi:hypothetical protein